MDVKLKIGNRIKELRDQTGMSQKDLAYAADLDRSYIASVENGKRNVSIINIEKIAMALDVTLSDFFRNDKFDDIKGNLRFDRCKNISIHSKSDRSGRSA